MSLLLHYAFDGSGTTVADTSGNGYDGVATDAAVQVGGVASITAAGHRVTRDATATALRPAVATLAAWVDVAASGAAGPGYPLHQARSFDSTAVGIWVARTGAAAVAVDAVVRGGGGVVVLNSSIQPSRGAPHHVALTYDGATARLYVDGVQGASAAVTGALVYGDATYQSWQIGDHAHMPAGMTNYTVDDVRLYDYGLSAAEVAALAAGSPPPSLTITGSSSAASATSTTSLALPTPIGAVAGEVLVAVLRHQQASATALWDVPAGWTALVNVTSTGGQRAMAIMARPAEGAPASTTFTRSLAARCVGQMFRVAGADVAAYDAGGSAAHTVAGNATTLSAWTVAHAGALVLYAAAQDLSAGAPALVPPAAWSGGAAHVLTTGTPGDTTAVSSTWLTTGRGVAAGTAAAAATATWSRVTAQGGVAAAIRPAPTGEAPPATADLAETGPEPADAITVEQAAAAALTETGPGPADAVAVTQRSAAAIAEAGPEPVETIAATATAPPATGTLTEVGPEPVDAILGVPVAAAHPEAAWVEAAAGAAWDAEPQEAAWV